MKPVVRIILGSKSDEQIGNDIMKMLDRFGIRYDFHISSAHRKPEHTMRLAMDAESDGCKIIIAAAGMAAHLPGVVAAWTTIPVIGVPLSSNNLDGLDAALSILQMPTGVPVATVAINGGKNAAILAAQILALQDQDLQLRLKEYKKSLSL